MSLLEVILSSVFRAEKISIPEALLLSLIGFSIVFVVLILLIIVIRVLTALTMSKASVPAAGVQATAASVAPIGPSGKVPALGSIGECALHTVDDKTAALLMAIVADNLKAPLNELRFISIREI